MIELDIQVKAHGHGETDKKNAWYSATLVGDSPALLEVSTLKLTLKSEKESLFTSYPIGKIVSLKIHDPQRKLTEASK